MRYINSRFTLHYITCICGFARIHLGFTPVLKLKYSNPYFWRRGGGICHSFNEPVTVIILRTIRVCRFIFVETGTRKYQIGPESIRVLISCHENGCVHVMFRCNGRRLWQCDYQDGDASSLLCCWRHHLSSCLNNYVTVTSSRWLKRSRPMLCI